jgi:type VI secretion system protein ImpB
MAINDEIPKSRLTMTYRTQVDGEKETVSLPLRLMLMGDLSKGSSTDRQVDLDERGIRNLDGKNLNSLMNDMNMSMSFSVPNKIDPDKSEDLAITLPVKSMKSFDPATLSESVPKLKSLLLLRKLLLEVQGNLDNRKDFRKLVRALAQDESAVSALLGELEGYESFKLPNAGNA